jgi:putative transposase
LVEGHGVPIGLAVDGANRPDMHMVRETSASIPVERPEPTAAAPQHLGLDNGYNYAEPKAIVEEFGFTAQLPPKKDEAQAVKRRARLTVRR